uniref:Protein kinase domain-containing protein n=1 Tax=Davidia involucrata TaxID=16924 RepID=A0A5B6ZIV1_DAVIN
MTSEAPVPSGPWIQQESTSVVSKDGFSVGKNVKNNVSIQTGEEFSMEFLQDRVIPRKVPAVFDVAQNHEKRVALNDNQNCQLGYEELTRILGLRRMDSDATEFASAKGSIAEFENGSFGYLKESGACGHGPSKATSEVNYDQAALGPSAPPINVSESSQSYQPFVVGVSDGSQSYKMKFLCSFGGKILPRPGDGKLRYVGGDTRIISIRKNLSWEELVKKTLGICNQPHTIKYQLPGEDLDALISVSSDEDLQNMIEEYHGLERLGGSQRLRIFLIPLTDENTYPLDATTIQPANPDYQYVVAVNGIVDPSPRKNHNGPYLASEVNQLKTNLDCNPSFHRNSFFSLHPLETKDGLGVSHPPPFINESQILTRSPNQSPPFSPILVQQEDIKSHHIQFDKDKSLRGSSESSSLFSTAQLPPEISSADAAGYYHLPQGETLLNYHHPNKKVDINQPSKPSIVHFHDRTPSREFVASSRLDRNDSNFNEYSFERPILKEKAFNYENLISHPEDAMGLMSGLNDSIESHHGISHAFSDSQLQNHGGRSGYCSKEGMSPSSPLNFTTPQLPSLVVSAALQEKPVQLQENIDLVNPQLQIKLLNIEPTLSHRRMDLPNRSLGSESSSRVEYTHKDTYDNGERHQIAKEDASKYNIMTQNHNEENPLSCDMMDGFDEDLLLHQGGKLCESRLPATATDRIEESANISCDPISTPCVNTPTQELQVSERMVPASSAIDLKAFDDTMMQEPRNYQLEKGPVELIVKGRRAAKDQQHVSPGFMGGEEGSDTLWAKNSEVAGIFPGSKQQSHDENSLSDLLCGLSNGPVSHESPALLPVASQKNMGLQEPMLISSKDLYPSAVCVDAGPNANSQKKYIGLQEPMLISSENFYPSTVRDDAGPNAYLHKNEIPTLLQNPTKDAGLRGEISILDEAFVNYPDQKVQKSGLEVCSSEKRKLEDITLNKYNGQNQLDSAVIVEDMIGSIPPRIKSSSAAVLHVVDATDSEIISPSATEADSIVPESDSEDARADDGYKDESISDAMIAEMEADIYGLQIIKNVDLEELQELGSGTYGTVYHGKWRGTDVAIKRIKKSCFAGRSSEQERLTKDFWREAQILSNLHHPNVVAFYGVVPDGAGGTLATVTEFMVNGSLRHVLLKKDRSLDRRKKLIIAMDAAFGMEYLHSKNIVHFDLKCDNLLVNLRDPQRPICKVGDFGLSRIKRNTLVSGGVRGTLPWMAPELLNGSSSQVSEKVDVFSFGIAMWEILTGEEPYANMHCGAIIGGIVKNTLRPLIPERCDPEWRRLMEQCWSADPEARPSFTDITNRLQSMSVALQAKGHNNLARQMKPNISV